ncbi:hypothetical protein GIB67_024840 [Kingdonia uniflora]|uniref:tRNA:m(4)X modification enzyme TRM13 n=1 Tax=Kingdonia uniflora TaxID=39325 RepID=A0A7J7NZ61_9MAGN|nr:hypothetical protein GIB67_024840 [Kingdonia uniflora]
MATPRCKLWLPKKNRHCANTPSKDSQYCGNHNPSSEEQRIPCPLDPSHSVLKENLEAHIKRCPLLKQTQSLEQQPYYNKGINASMEDEGEGEGEEEDPNLDSEKPGNVTTSNMKRSAVYKMGVPELLGLISKIRSIHGSVCKDIRDSYKIPDVCGVWLQNEVERKLPFQEKHVLQQASILGNMKEIGVLDNPVKDEGHSESGEQFNFTGISKDVKRVPAVVEFGAGRGYLTQILADCYGIEKVYLVERRSYKLKADRSLRQKESLTLERLRIDIEDLDLNAVESLRGLPYLAIGKHLCGPATDLTLRCCFRRQCSQEKGVLKRDCCSLKGLAIATCCHHLCQWKHYISTILISYQMVV